MVRRNAVKEGTNNQAKKQYKVPILKSKGVKWKVGQTEAGNNGHPRAKHGVVWGGSFR